MTKCIRGVLMVSLVGWLASCAGDPSNSGASASGGAAESAAAAAPTKKGFDKFLASNPMYSSSGQRKEASEGFQTNSMFNNELSKKEISAKDYSKKSFWGTKEYAKKVYGGDTDGSRFLTAAREGSQGAREGAMVSGADGQAYNTGTYRTGDARESGRSEISRTSDAETDVRREVWKQPEVRGYSVEDTRGMMGR
ncbi:hypothetical protein HNR46_002251 [Haloferula luteola]|uniref:Lipoprotein n=1 Tax=Haloferula luteola TaxID=595692 RepID=A0A840VDQ3_9BACT|nr:hypothetical protein [Haloferula luteola]MBB5352010.1 hypothetical protein [Haloferula luteola]